MHVATAASDSPWDEIRYVVDVSGRIVSIEGPWVEFARANGIADPHLPIGEALLSHVAGPSPRQLFNDLMQAVRARQRPIELPFRCDGPDLRRFMRMRLEPLPDGSIRFRSWMLRSEPRSRVRLLDLAVRRSTELISQCSWCKRIRQGDEWMEIEAAIHRMGLLDEPELPDISHGMCPDCERDLQADLDG